MNIIRFVKNNVVTFARLRHGVAYYNVKDTESEDTYQFPVPLSDIGDATLEATEKAMLFMRYIRQAISDSTLAKL